MMKKLVLAAALATATGGCYGSFSAFHAVHDWNGHVTDSKISNSAIHALFWIVPVYEVILFADLIVFNTVEFATDKPVFGK